MSDKVKWWMKDIVFFLKLSILGKKKRKEQTSPSETVNILHYSNYNIIHYSFEKHVTADNN